MMTAHLPPDDNAVTAVPALDPGEEGSGEPIPRGHKPATQPVPKGAPVQKFAQVIGYAPSSIAPGEHAHSQNPEFRNFDVEYEVSTNLRPAVPTEKIDTLMGYRRATGERLIELICWWEDCTHRNRASMDNNSSPGNKRVASVEEVGREIHEMVLRTASGEVSKSEAQGLGDHEFEPWLIGVVM